MNETSEIKFDFSSFEWQLAKIVGTVKNLNAAVRYKIESIIVPKNIRGVIGTYSLVSGMALDVRCLRVRPYFFFFDSWTSKQIICNSSLDNICHFALPKVPAIVCFLKENRRQKNLPDPGIEPSTCRFVVDRIHLSQFQQQVSE